MCYLKLAQTDTKGQAYKLDAGKRSMHERRELNGGFKSSLQNDNASDSSLCVVIVLWKNQPTDCTFMSSCPPPTEGDALNTEKETVK